MSGGAWAELQHKAGCRCIDRIRERRRGRRVWHQRCNHCYACIVFHIRRSRKRRLCTRTTVCLVLHILLVYVCLARTSTCLWSPPQREVLLGVIPCLRGFVRLHRGVILLIPLVPLPWPALWCRHAQYPMRGLNSKQVIHCGYTSYATKMRSASSFTTLATYSSPSSHVTITRRVCFLRGGGASFRTALGSEGAGTAGSAGAGRPGTTVLSATAASSSDGTQEPGSQRAQQVQTITSWKPVFMRLGGMFSSFSSSLSLSSTVPSGYNLLEPHGSHSSSLLLEFCAFRRKVVHSCQLQKHNFTPCSGCGRLRVRQRQWWPHTECPDRQQSPPRPA